ncbi:hypothetical protein [Streptomyces sp. NPDC096030]|uniref:hypothetical protein n=1 Tax=Streptomyces sp. NPDC096030 TaxID=3155423 RepID=UPI00332F5454
MATITGLANDPFKRNPAVAALLESHAVARKGLDPLGLQRNAMKRVQESALRNGVLVASLATLKSTGRLRQSIASTDLQEIADRAQQVREAVDSTQDSLRQIRQLRSVIDLIEPPVTAELGLPDEAFSRARQLLDELYSSPPSRLEEGLDGEEYDLAPSLEGELREIVSALEPNVGGMDRDKAKKAVVAYIGAVAFVLIVWFELSYPELSELLTKAAASWGGAQAASRQAGKIWDKIMRSEEEGDDSPSDQ